MCKALRMNVYEGECGYANEWTINRERGNKIK